MATRLLRDAGVAEVLPLVLASVRLTASELLRFGRRGGKPGAK